MTKSASDDTNLLVMLYRLAHRQQENFTTEALAHLLRHLLRHEPSVAARMLRWLNDLPYFDTPNHGLVVRTQHRTEEHGIPDLRITGDDLEVFIEVKLDGGLTFEQAENYANELQECEAAHKKLVALVGAAPAVRLPDGTLVRTWAELGVRLEREVEEGCSAVTRHLAGELVGLLRHLHLMPLRVCSKLSEALQAHVEWAKANPDQPAVTRTRFGSLSRLGEIPHTPRPLLELLSQMEGVLSTAKSREGSGVKTYAFDSGPNMQEPWIGFNINSLGYFFYVPLTAPEHVVVQRWRLSVDPTLFDGTLGELEPPTSKGVVRWRDTLDLMDDDGAFFRESVPEQTKRLDEFFRRAFKYAQRLVPPPTTDEEGLDAASSLEFGPPGRLLDFEARS